MRQLRFALEMVQNDQQMGRSLLSLSTNTLPTESGVRIVFVDDDAESKVTRVIGSVPDNWSDLLSGPANITERIKNLSDGDWDGESGNRDFIGVTAPLRASLISQ